MRRRLYTVTRLFLLILLENVLSSTSRPPAPEVVLVNLHASWQDE